MVILKGCKRCEGDVVKRSDNFGDYFQCLMCSRVTYIENGDKYLKKPSRIKQSLLRPRNLISL